MIDADLELVFMTPVVHFYCLQFIYWTSAQNECHVQSDEIVGITCIGMVVYGHKEIIDTIMWFTPFLRKDWLYKKLVTSQIFPSIL